MLELSTLKSCRHENTPVRTTKADISERSVGLSISAVSTFSLEVFSLDHEWVGTGTRSSPSSLGLSTFLACTFLACNFRFAMGG
jgi:hypothetical protein